MLLGALNERALAHSMGVSDALQRPVAMDEVMLDALPVGRSGLDLIGNLLRPRRFFPLPLWERVARAVAIAEREPGEGLLTLATL